MAWDDDCADCRYMGVYPDKNGCFPCTNGRSNYKNVNANMRKCGDFGEVTYYNRPSSERQECRNISKRGHGYYIFTAIAEILGESIESQNYLSFMYLRDEVMTKNEKYSVLLEEYDQFGPVCAEAIKNDDNNKQYASYLSNYYCEAIKKAVIGGQNDLAAVIFEAMFNTVKNKYNINQEKEEIKVKGLK